MQNISLPNHAFNRLMIFFNFLIESRLANFVFFFLCVYRVLRSWRGVLIQKATINISIEKFQIIVQKNSVIDLLQCLRKFFKVVTFRGQEFVKDLIKE